MVNKNNKNKTLTIFQTTELLERLQKGNHPPYIAYKMGITTSQVFYYKRKYMAYSPELIAKAIDELKRRYKAVSAELRNFKKQENCTPIKVFFKCYSCGFVGGENNLGAIIEHLNRCKKEKKIVEKHC